MRRFVTMCSRCEKADAAEEGGYCTVCVVQTRVEVSGGIRRLAQYLAAWAAFDDWCAGQADDPAAG